MTFKLLIVDDSKLARMSAAKAMNSLYPDWTRVEAQNADEAMEEIVEIERGHFGAIDAEERLGFRLTDTIVRFIQFKSDGQMQLFARGLEAVAEDRIKQNAAIAQGFLRLGVRNVHFGQPAPVVFHLFQKLRERTQVRRSRGNDRY